MLKKEHLNINSMIERLNKSRKLIDEYFMDLSKQISNVYEEICKNGFSLISGGDSLDYGNLIYNEVVCQLYEYLRDRNIDVEKNYNKLRLIRNSRTHHDDKPENSDFDYVESILKEYQLKPISENEMNIIKKEQIKFGESLGIYKDGDTDMDKLKKTYNVIMGLKNLIKNKKP